MDTVQQLSYLLNSLYFLIAGFLVMWLVAGLTVFQAGLVRSKNTIDVLMKSLVLIAITAIIYMLLGYATMYSDGLQSNPYFPNFIAGEKSLLALLHADNAHNQIASVFFQLMLAAVVILIVNGAMAERVTPSALFIFSIVMASVIYPIGGYWVWGNGFLRQLGFIDEAGAGVIHLAGASAALAGLLVLGPRLNKYRTNNSSNLMAGGNLPLTCLGAFMIWLGSFGFNSGFQLTSTSVENINLLANTVIFSHMSACGGLLAAYILTRLLFGKPDLTVSLNGLIAGLVAVAASPTNMHIVSAILIGAGAGVLVVLSIMLLDRLKIDDPIGAISTHGVGGIWGLLIVSKNSFSSWVHQLPIQFYGVFVIACWAFFSSLLVFLLIRWIMEIRVRKEAEYQGLDRSYYGINAYNEREYSP